MAGLSPGAAAFARRLIDAGFTVHLPLLFGRPEQAGTARGLLGLFCVRREFSLLRVGKPSPVGSWVRALARDVYDPPIPRAAHSVLTKEYVDDPDHPTAIASRKVVAFLTGHLH